MNIEDKKVVSFHYTLRDEHGEQLESSREGDPMTYLHGAGNIIPGLEKAMVGKVAGDQFEADVDHCLQRRGCHTGTSPPRVVEIQAFRRKNRISSRHRSLPGRG